MADIQKVLCRRGIKCHKWTCLKKHPSNRKLSRLHKKLLAQRVAALTFGYRVSMQIRDKSASVQVDQEMGFDETWGGTVWDSGLVLTRYLDSFGKELMNALTIIDVGAGTGIVGLMAALLGAKAFLTDLPSVLPLLTHNAQLNEQNYRALHSSQSSLARSP